MPSQSLSIYHTLAEVEKEQTKRRAAATLREKAAGGRNVAEPLATLVVCTGDDGNGGVYDVTHFLADHPGGEEVLLSTAGMDITRKFVAVGHSVEAVKLLETLRIGTFVASPPAASCGSGTSPAPSASSVSTPLLPRVQGGQGSDQQQPPTLRMKLNKSEKLSDGAFGSFLWSKLVPLCAGVAVGTAVYVLVARWRRRM